jgi:hypothetical protein
VRDLHLHWNLHWHRRLRWHLSFLPFEISNLKFQISDAIANGFARRAPFFRNLSRPSRLISPRRRFASRYATAASRQPEICFVATMKNVPL